MENPDLMAGQSEVVVLEEQLRIYAMKNPEDVAAVIKNWGWARNSFAWERKGIHGQKRTEGERQSCHPLGFSGP